MFDEGTQSVQRNDIYTCLKARQRSLDFHSFGLFWSEKVKEAKIIMMAF